MHTLAGLDLNLLKALDALLFHAHVSRAAEALGLTQSAASRALGRLREVFEDPLLVRSGRGLALTPRAAALQPQVARVLSEIDRLLTAGPDFDPRTARRTFRISAADHYNTVVLPDVIAALAREAPWVDIELTTEVRNTEALESGRIEVAIAPRGTVDGPEIMQQNLFVEDFVVLLRAGHPALEGPWNAEAFAALGHVLVAPRGNPGGPVDTQLAKLGLRRRVAVLTASFASAPHIVAATDLVVTLPRRTAHLARHLGVVERPVPFDPMSFRISAFWHVRDHTDPGHRWFRELLRAVAPSSPENIEAHAVDAG
jgi:DNA-binding transcriptional LysR family regulator